MTTSKAIKVSVVNYNVPPVVRIETPVNNQTIGEHATFRFGVFAKDPNDKISSVKFYSGTTLLHTETVIPYGYWWKDIKAGSYTITAVATDDKGLSATSAPVHFTVVPNKIPTVNIITPANYKTFTGPATIDFEAVAKDADGKISKVEFYNGKTLLTTERLLPYTYRWKDVPVGNYAITAKAYDNWGVATTSAVVNVSVKPNIAPTVSIINPANEAKLYCTCNHSSGSFCCRC